MGSKANTTLISSSSKASKQAGRVVLFFCSHVQWRVGEVGSGVAWRGVFGASEREVFFSKGIADSDSDSISDLLLLKHTVWHWTLPVK